MHGNSSPYDFDLSFVLFMIDQNISCYISLHKIQPRTLHLLIIATVVLSERRNFLNRKTTSIHTWQQQSLEDVETPTDLPDEGLINSPGREFYQEARNLMLTCSVEITAGGETDGAGVALPPLHRRA